MLVNLSGHLCIQPVLGFWQGEINLSRFGLLLDVEKGDLPFLLVNLSLGTIHMD